MLDVLSCFELRLLLADMQYAYKVEFELLTDLNFDLVSLCPLLRQVNMVINLQCIRFDTITNIFLSVHNK